MKRQIARHWQLLVVGVLTIPAIIPIVKPGFFPMHDDQQVVRLFEMDRALAAGQFPARWVGNLGFGYGYPLFIFYPPLVYYLAEFFHLLLGTSFIVSIKLVFAFAFFSGAFAMYLWAKEHFGKFTAILAAAFYTYIPYHAVDAYVRGALAELTAFVWLPFILWSTDRLIVKQANKHWLWLSLWLALLMLTHNLIFLPFFPLFLIYAGFLLIKTKSLQATSYKLILAALLAFGLSAFFWLPALVEKKYTLVDDILLSELANYKLHFVYPSQLWNSLWGYGGSTQGPLDGMSFKIGKLHVVLAILAPVFWTIVSLLKPNKKNKHFSLYSFILLCLFLLSAFMTTGASQPIWELATPLKFLQFPWRYLTFTALFSSFLAAAAFAAVSSSVKGDLIKIASALTIFTLLFYPNFKLFNPQTYLDVRDDYYLSDDFIKWRVSKTSFEFAPKGVKTIRELSEIEKKEITQVDILRADIGGGETPYRILSGVPEEIEIKRNVPGELSITLKSPLVVPTIMEFDIFDFPGWRVYIDGNKGEHKSDNDLKLITIEIPGGEHTVSARFQNTPVRKAANFTTLISLIILGIQVYRVGFKSKRQSSRS